MRLTLFENKVYWTDSSKQAVLSVEKTQSENSVKSVTKIRDAKTIKALHSLAQPKPSQNPCGNNNGGCQHMCIVTAAGGKESGLGYRCACDIGIVLSIYLYKNNNNNNNKKQPIHCNLLTNFIDL